MAKPAGGFDPDRVFAPMRSAPVIPRILQAPLESGARGFTEVKIVGVGGAGTNAVNRMIEADVPGVEFLAINTDAQALNLSQALKKLRIGGRGTRGLGAGGDPAAGARAAEASAEAIRTTLKGADMVFITAGMGGGTGTGAAPVVADIGREEKALTVAIVTLPFPFEGPRKFRIAEEGVRRLEERVDALIVIPNERLLQLADRKMTLVEALRLADDMLRQGVQGISDLITMTGIINLDFADVKGIMTSAGTALMALGQAEGERRALEATQAALTSPLLDVSIEGATGVLMNITGGPDMSLAEVTEAAEFLHSLVDPSANIVFGAVVHPRPRPEVKVTLIATGLKQARRTPLAAPKARERPIPERSGPTMDGAAWPRPPEGGPAEEPYDLDLPTFLRRRRA